MSGHLEEERERKRSAVRRAGARGRAVSSRAFGRDVPALSSPLRNEG